MVSDVYTQIDRTGGQSFARYSIRSSLSRERLLQFDVLIHLKYDKGVSLAVSLMILYCHMYPSIWKVAASQR